MNSGGGLARPEDAVQLPFLGLGTGTLSQDRVTSVVTQFLSLGGRHLDTAVMYGNYDEIKLGIQASGHTNRSELVVTFKVMPFGRDYVKAKVEAAIEGMDLDYVDIGVLHWPGDVANGKLLHGASLPECVDEQEGPDPAAPGPSWRRCRRESYSALLELLAEGRVRATGVSNFAMRHLDEMREDSFEPPAVHQMELHPFWFPEELLYRCMTDKTVVQAYGVLGGKAKKASVSRHKGFLRIGEQANATAAQVLLRWATQLGVSAITGASTAAHLRENLRAFELDLTDEQMGFMSSVPPENQVKTYGPLPDEIA